MKITLGLSEGDVIRIYELFEVCNTLENIFSKKDVEELTEIEEAKYYLVDIGKYLLERMIGLIKNEEIANGADLYADDDPLDPGGINVNDFILCMNEAKNSRDFCDGSSGGVLSFEEIECIKNFAKELNEMESKQ